MNYKTLILTILVGVFATGPLYAADTSHGKSLQEKNCMGCHDDAMYTRENRKVTSLGGLQKQIMRCEQSLGLQWFDDDVSAVTEYLNTSYYHYK
jgi:cytochrome c553